MDMVVHVATAIKDALGKAMNAKPLLGDASSGDWYTEGEAGSINLEDVSRTAIAAMREPTEAMLERRRSVDNDEYIGVDERCARELWAGMIDAALVDYLTSSDAKRSGSP
jgi:hypothetical protein